MTQIEAEEGFSIEVGEAIARFLPHEEIERILGVKRTKRVLAGDEPLTVRELAGIVWELGGCAEFRIVPK